MDLNPVEIEDLFDTNIMETVSIEKIGNPHTYFDNKFYKEKLYEDEGTESFVKSIRDRTVKEVIEKVLIACECNDVYQMHHLVSLVKEIRFSLSISTSEAEQLLLILDKYTKKNYKDFNFVNDILSLMVDLVNMKKVSVKLDWKVYYKMFLQFFCVSKHEFTVNYSEKFLRNVPLGSFVKKASRLFAYTEEDYKFLKEEVQKRLVTKEGQIAVGLLIAHLFLPSEFFQHDKELQEKFLTILENKSELSNYILLNFCKVINNPNGLKVDKEQFIDDVFGICFCNMTDGMALTYFSWPEAINKDKNSTVALSFVLANFIIHPLYKEYRQKVNRNLLILVNLISSHLTENNLSDSAFFFVKLLLRSIKQLACAVCEFEVSEYDSFKEFEVLEEHKERVDEIRSMFHPIVSKCLLYNEPATFSVLLEFLSLSNQKLVHKDFNDIIFHLFENSSNDFNFFIRKITIFLRCFLENIEEKIVFRYINELIDTSLDKISCVSGSLNNSVVEFFNILLTLVLHSKTTPTANFKKMRDKLDGVCIILIKKILNLYSLFANIVEELPYSLLFTHMSRFAKQSTAEEISLMIFNFLKENTLKDTKEFSFLSYFLLHFSRINASDVNLAKNVWNFCFDSLVETSGDSSHKLAEISKDQFVYIKKLLSSLENYEHIDCRQFIILVKLLLNDKEEKKRKLAYVLMKYFVYNITLPVVRNNRINYLKKDNLQFIIDVFNEVIQPYEEIIQKVVESKDERIPADLTDTITIYLRISYSYILKYNNIFLRDFDYSEYNQALSKMPEYKFYEQIRDIKKRLVENSLSFYNFCKEKKLLSKNEKYFRRTFFGQLIEYDRFYHVRLISTYRKYLVYYRELKFGEMSFVDNILAIISFYSNVKLFKVQEKSCNMKVIENVFKCYIKTEDRLLIDHSLFKTALILQHLQPDSKTCFDFFNTMIDLTEKKLNKIPITKDNLVTDLKRFDRIFEVVYSLIAVYIAKVSDISLLLKTLTRFRLLIDKFKFNISGSLEYLTSLTKLVNYFIPKCSSLMDKKMDKVFSSYLNINEEVNSSFHNDLLDNLTQIVKTDVTQKQTDLTETQSKMKENLRHYITETLDDEANKFNSSNYLDSMNLLVDFMTTIKLSLNVYLDEDKKILSRLESVFLDKFIEEEDMLKKRVYLTGLGIVEHSRYKLIKQYVNPHPPSQECLPLKDKRNFNISHAKFDKTYEGKSTVKLFSDIFTSEDKIYKFIETLHKFQNYKENINLLKSNGGVFDKITNRLAYLFTPQYNDASLIIERNFLIQSYTDSPALFNLPLSKVLFFVLFFSGVDDYTLIFDQLDKFRKEKEADDLIYVNVFLVIVGALIKKDKINKNYKRITELLKKALSFYTYNFNKRIDSEILNLLGYSLCMFSPEETKLILSDESTDSLFFFKYDDLLAMRLVDLIHQRFPYRSHLVFSDSSVREIEGLIAKVRTDTIMWVKNSFDFECLYSDYLYISKAVVPDWGNDYLTKFSDKVPQLITSTLEFFRKSQTKESLKLLNVVFRETLPYLMTNPNLLVEVVSEFTCYIRLDPQNYKKRLDYNVALFHKLLKFGEYDYFEIISLLAKKMDTYVFPESFKFCTDLMKKLLVPRIHKIMIGNEVENFDKFSNIVSVAKNAECRDYFCHYVLYLVILSLSDSTTQTIISNLHYQIKIEKSEKNNRMVTSLVTVLTSFLMDYEICLENATEYVILKLKEINKSLFKNIGTESQIIKKSISRFYNKYSYTFEFVKRQVSHECQMAIIELSKSHSYFI